MTPHSIVRSLPLLGWKLMATAKGAWDMTTIGAERPDTEVAVILGVDTHLDFHVGQRCLASDSSAGCFGVARRPLGAGAS